MEILCSMTYMKMHFLKIIVIIILLLFMCLCVLLAEGRKQHPSLWNWSCRWLWGAATMLGIEPLFSGGAAVLSVTEPSLQPPKHFLKKYKGESLLNVCYKVISQLQGMVSFFSFFKYISTVSLGANC